VSLPVVDLTLDTLRANGDFQEASVLRAGNGRQRTLSLGEGLKAAANQEGGRGGAGLTSEKRPLDRGPGRQCESVKARRCVLRCDSSCSWTPVLLPVLLRSPVPPFLFLGKMLRSEGAGCRIGP